MPYSDNNPERRNLIILSLSIIIFYLADGQVDGGVKLPLINMTFQREWVLACFVWVMLVWFLFRYMITNTSNFGHYLEDNVIRVNMDYEFVRNNIKPVTFENLGLESAYIFKNKGDSSWYIVNRLNAKLNGVGGYFVVRLYLIKIALKSRVPTDYYMPYFLCFSAVLLGLNSWSWFSWYLIIPVLVLAVIQVLYIFRK